MSNSVPYWAQSITNCIRQCIKNRIDTSILPIPFDDKDTYMKCDEFIKQYTKMKQHMAMIQRMGGMEEVMKRMQANGGFPGSKK